MDVNGLGISGGCPAVIGDNNIEARGAAVSAIVSKQHPAGFDVLLGEVDNRIARLAGERNEAVVRVGHRVGEVIGVSSGSTAVMSSVVMMTDLPRFTVMSRSPLSLGGTLRSSALRSAPISMASCP